ncbi:MAG: hypothetical protein ACLSG5_14345 [Oscillospiraceae bacterium]
MEPPLPTHDIPAYPEMIYLSAGGERRERLQGAVPEVHGNAAVVYLGVGDDFASCRAGGDLRERGATRLSPSDVSSAEPFSRVIAAVKLSAPLYIGAERGKALFCSPFSAAYSPQTA